MRTVEIPREAWVEQLNEFTAIHEGWLVSLDVLGPEIGAQPEIVNLPLLGVSADRIDHDGAIAVSVMLSATEHLNPHDPWRDAHLHRASRRRGGRGTGDRVGRWHAEPSCGFASRRCRKLWTASCADAPCRRAEWLFLLLV